MSFDHFTRFLLNWSKSRGWHKVKGYYVYVQPDALDGGFVVEAVGLPGCVSQGETVDEALTNIADAIDGWLAAPAPVEDHLTNEEWREFSEDAARSRETEAG